MPCTLLKWLELSKLWGKIMKIKIKKLSETAIIPTRGTIDAAGYDLYSDIDKAIEVKPHETVKVTTGLAISVPEGYFGGIFARSGLSTKKGLRPANCCGVIDSDYRGPIIVSLHNDSKVVQIIEPMERIAQLIVMPYLTLEFEEWDELDETLRGHGGFGSTGA